MGGSKGGGGHTPYEAPESGRSKERVKIVEILSEGEIGGLVDELKSVFLDNTPVQAADGSYNFSNVEMEGRLGTQDQDVIPEFNAVEKEVAVGVEVKKTTPITRTVTDGSVNRIRMKLGVQALFEQNDQGDTNPTMVDLKITVGTREIPFTFNGKHSNPYSRAIEISDLPAVPFTIKVERITDDSKSNRLANKTVWASYTEIIDSQFAYPNTAYAGVKFDSEYFSGIPTRTYEIYGIKVRVPSNYDPVARTYSGLWDGSFKIAYTNNPAWVLMDIVTNKRYGLGDRLGEFSVDKWALYQISQYCDQQIPNGFGGVEPRFTCNLWITEQRSAYDVLSDLCSIFRAIPVWNGTELTFIMDRPSDPVWTYTNANVVGGEFSRQYSAMKARHNAIQVEYKDASNAYTNTIEYVSDDEAIRKFGLNLKKVTAYGCTSRGQAFRTGKWLLETERLETETVTFTVGSEGLMNIPGDIIRVTDNHYAGANIGGRVVAINGRSVTLDREIEVSGNSYLSFINSNAKHSNIKISSATGCVVTLDSVPTGLTVNGVWSLTTAKITSRLYRCMTITENSDEGTYTIVALQHEPQKEAIVDNGASFEPVNTSLLKTPTLESADVTGTINGGMKITWSTTSGVGTLTYDIKILKEGKLYAYHKGVSSTEFALEDLPDGNYTVVIIAKNASGQIVSEKSQTFTIDRPPIPANVEVSGGLTAVVISWGMVNEATFTEIWASETNDIRTATRIAKVNGMMYSHELGARQVRYYWVRHTRGQNNGPFFQQQGLKAETGADIDEELALLNEKLGKNIIEEVFDTAMPARKLEMIKTVERLETPTENLGHHQIYNEEDGKLYVWDGTKYTAKVQAVDLEGQLASSQLDQTLIDQLNRADSTASSAALEAGKVKNSLAQEITNRQNAINAEITNRQNAIKAESANRNNAIKAESASLTKKIQDEASARGTAINQLQNVDAQQAQQITTLTAKADNALSGITAEQKARADGDKANADKITVLTSRVESAESSITTLQTSVATANRSMSELSQNLNAKIDNISVGGRNLLLKTASGSGYLRWSNRLENISSQDGESARVEYSDPSKRNDGIYNALFNTHSIKTGQEVIVSFEYRTTSNLNYTYLLRKESVKGNVALIRSYFESQPLADGEWHKQVIKFKATSDIDNFRLLVGSYLPEVGTFLEVKKFKVEFGNIATDWTPAPEDIESSVNAVSADLTTYKQTQANIDKAQTDQITAHTARLGSAEASLTSTSRTVATLDGKVQALHTIQAVAISGGKKAIAGISMGATGSESSVIVMADKFNVVKNAQDGNVKPMFGVVNNKVAVNGDLIADGTISARMMAANAVQAGTIQAGAINANHIQAGQISADKLAIGLGGNLLYNPIFANLNSNGVPDGWSFGNFGGVGSFNKNTDVNYGLRSYALPNENCMRGTRTSVDQTTFMQLTQRVPVNRNQWYIASVYMGNHRAVKCELIIQYLNNAGVAISATHKTGGNGFGGLESADRVFIKFQAPATCESIQFYLRQTGIVAGNTNSIMFVARPMLEECTEYTKEPSPWQNSGVTAIHGGSIVTNTITADKIGAGQVTTNHMVAGSIDGKVLRAGTVTADTVKASVSLSSPKISGGTITGNAINGGSISGTTITGTNINGNTLSGNAISGGSININGNFIVDGNGNLTANTGTFKGKVYAANLLDDVCQVYEVNPNSSITIPSFPKSRVLLLLGFSVTAFGGAETGSNQSNGRTSVQAKISSSLGGEVSVSASSSVVTGYETQQTNGFFRLPAHQTARITYTTSISGNGRGKFPPAMLISIC